ncbi:MAG: beta-galactosidase [Planctomycetota bacterium]
MEWAFEDPKDLASAANLEPVGLERGQVSGWTCWDPYLYLAVPTKGIDANKLTWLTVRMYSSTQADLLDIYYKSTEGHWCLGGKLPIEKGWATYRVDLVGNSWRETQTGEASRQWGGPCKRVATLRIDPGNQAGRWIIVDDVRLLPADAGLVEGVTVEPRGTMMVKTLHVPRTIEAGERIVVSAEVAARAPKDLKEGTAFCRLWKGDTILRVSDRVVSLAGGPISLQFSIPTSSYWYPGSLRVEVGCHELDLDKNGLEPCSEIALTNRRIGQAKPPVAELRSIGSDAAIFVNNQPIPGFMYASHGGLHIEHHKEMARNGIHLYSDWFGASHYSDMGHVEPGRYDYGEFDRYFAAILDADPDAYFLPHIGVTGPLWWQKAHPDEMCRFEDGSTGPTSFASELWKREMGDDLGKLVAYLRRAPYADRIIGYIIYGGYTAEWQMWGTWQKSRDDYSRPAVNAFRAFLGRKYIDDRRLRAAWNDPDVTIAAATMPDWAKRRPGGPLTLRDPESERQAMDFYEFTSNMTADALLHFARVAREAAGDKALVGTYYGYLTAHGINQQDSGHLAARRVFDSPYIDFLMSPPNYWFRKPGETSTFMAPSDSLRMRGKLWLDESDHRTHLSVPDAGYGRADNLEDTLGVFWREFAEVLCKRAAVSWYDMAGGWFAHPRILSDMGRAHAIMKGSLSLRKPFAPEVGVFVDAESFYWMRPTDANRALVLDQVVTLPQAGVPWDFCLLSDIDAPWLPDYKFYIFLNAFCVNADRREAIAAKLEHSKATALFVYAPGYFDGSGVSLQNMEALTGIRIAKSDTNGKPQLILDAADPLAGGIGPVDPVGAKTIVAPLFYADDPDVRIAGRLVSGNQPGLVVKKKSGWTSIYSAAMPLPPSLIRNMAREAGVHAWIETDDALYADNQFLGIHAATEGRKAVMLPAGVWASDALSGRRLPMREQTVVLDMRRGSTVLLGLHGPE